MKKLMTTMLAVAVGVGLHTAGMADTGTSFEGLEAGDYNINATTGELSAQEAGQTYWVTNGTDQTLTVSSGTSVIAEYEYPGTPSRPQQYIDNGSSQAKYLSIKTTLGNPVTRNVSVGGTGTSIGAGFYFDSLVKFTAFDSDPAINLDGGKLAIWLKEAYSNGDSADPTGTNLVITAGYLQNGSAVVTNYPCNVTGVDFNDGGWHRVTVKAIGSIYSEDTVPGFVVYVDGVRAKSTEAKGIDTSALTDNAYAFNSDGALFPSADQSSGAVSTISSVAFDGQGDVDDLIFTSTAPDFAKDSEFFTIELGANVASLTYSVYGGSSATITETTMIEYAPGLRVAVTGVTYAPGYMTAGITSSASVDLEEGYYVVGAAAQKITANAKLAGAAINGTPYETAAAAFAAISGGTAGAGPFTVTLTTAAESGVELDSADDSVILDLAGNNITADENDAAAITLVSGTLLITNSTVTVGEVNGYDGGSALVTAGGTLTIAGGIYNGAVDVSSATSLITGGSFSVNDNKDPDSETLPPAPNGDLAKAVMTGYELEVVSGSSYYTLVEVVTPSTWTVTFLRDDDTTYDQETVDDGDYCTVPETPSKEHYSFLGWFAPGAGVAFDFANTPITGDITVKATYAPEVYTVSFNTAGGSVLPAISDQNVAYNQYATDPEVSPLKEGYQFQYWSADGSTEFVFANTPIVANTTLTAVYQAYSYTITYMYGESTLSGLTPATYTVADAVTLPTEVDLGVVGVSFEAWTNAQGEVVANWAAGAIGNKTFYAKTAAVVPTAIDPEDGTVEVTVTAVSEEAAIAGVLVTPPTGSGADAAEYKALFNFTAVETSSGSGEYTVTLTGIKSDVVTGVDTSAVTLLKSSASTGTITVPAGLYYRITPSTALPISGTPVSGLSTGASETVTKPGTTKGFYKIELSAVPFAVPNS